MIKTILCDLGNVIVIVDENKIIEGLAKYSDRGKSHIKQYFDTSIARSGFDKGKISANSFFKKFKNDLDLKLNFNQFKKVWHSCFSPNKDMEKLLRKLKKNYKLILLSNTDEIHFEYIKQKYKILNIFDELVLSYKVGYKKPDPKIYLYAIKKLKKSPNEMVYIDDIKDFIKAAKNCGIKAIQYKNIEKLKKDLKKLNIEI